MCLAFVQEPKPAPAPAKEKDQVPTASEGPSDESSTKALMDLVASLQKEVAGLREEMKDQPTVGQFEKLQHQLREQKAEIANMRTDIEAMQRKMGQMPTTSVSPQVLGPFCRFLPLVHSHGRVIRMCVCVLVPGCGPQLVQGSSFGGDFASAQHDSEHPRPGDQLLQPPGHIKKIHHAACLSEEFFKFNHGRMLSADCSHAEVGGAFYSN